MTAGWQEFCYGAALVLFVLAAVVAAVKRWGWPILVAVGLAFFALVSTWNAASLR